MGYFISHGLSHDLTSISVAFFRFHALTDQRSALLS